MRYKSFYKLILYLLLATGISVGESTFANPPPNSNNEVDSLKTALKENSNIDEVQTLIEILTYYHNVNPDSAHKYAVKLESKSEKTGHEKGKLVALSGFLNIDFIQGNYTQCINKALPFLGEAFDNPGYHVGNFYLATGNCYASIGLYKTGVELYLKAKDIFLDIEEVERLKSVENNLGASYIRMGDFEAAKVIFRDLEVDSDEDPVRVTKSVNLGFIDLGLKNYEEAKRHFEEVLNFGETSIETRGKAISSYKLGDLYNEIGEHKKAIEHYQKSLEYFSILNNEAQKINPLNGLAICHLAMGNNSEAEKYALEAEELGNKNNTLHELVRSTTTLANVYADNNNFEKAFEYSLLSKKLSDSLSVSQKNQEVQLLEAEFEFKLREEEIENARIAEQNKQNLYFGIVAGGLILSLVFGFILFRSKKRQEEANQQLSKVNDELEETNHIKDQLFSIIAHDLRNPLSSLYGMITLFEMKSAKQEEIERLIPVLAEQFKHTSNLLNNLLNWAKSQMEGYQVIKENFRIGDLIEDNIKLLKSRFEEKEITVAFEDNNREKVCADRNMINLVLLNLLSNTVKFCDKGDSVTITTQKNENYIEVKIRDTGVGISDDKIKTIFTNSFYSSAGTREEKGTGLGLMLCKEFVEKNDGEIWFDNTLEKGTAFYFTIPLSSQN